MWAGACATGGKGIRRREAAPTRKDMLNGEWRMGNVKDGKRDARRKRRDCRGRFAPSQ